ncbi:colanic acid biosynthesis glycosyltransferase WcaL [Cephaloticoccus primus]|uniref:Colanic acid biosynthesis glycosyltransferase WcaL n=1 Tax=Cephaloticoccus primus TaxID=1548207 RepID=A0A139SMN2_9BACT|nr:glycosyltransferase [Cephaloticoccus primus]KXU35866.1 colanic acid biosynthesis glycosyltransferase WcaL [Cephaloticoccus primus]
MSSVVWQRVQPLAFAGLSAETPTIAYLFTTFPKPTETFLQREVTAMLARGARLRLYSMWGGGGEFQGVPVQHFPKWRLFTLLWWIPYEAARRPLVLCEILRGLCTRLAPSWINFWENMLGAGFACLHARHFRKNPPALIHAPWGGAPASAAWLLWRLDGYRYSAAAHAYDIYEHGGDWWLREKLAHAYFVHTSTEMGRRELVKRGVPEAKIVCIRRGLAALPPLKPLRRERAHTPLRLVCVARLVEKKGLRHQLQVYAGLRSAGTPFEARIVGEGPLRGELEALAARLGIADAVRFTGHLAHAAVWETLEWADILLHTGMVAPSGDRDGLPNVIPEAMSVGTLVVSSLAAATTEAIANEETGLVAAVRDTGSWLAALDRLRRDDALAGCLRANARAWVEENFDAHKNAAKLFTHFEEAIRRDEQ